MRAFFTQNIPLTSATIAPMIDCVSLSPNEKNAMNRNILAAKQRTEPMMYLVLSRLLSEAEESIGDNTARFIPFDFL